MTQDSRIASQLGLPIDLLKETLQSHRYALSLNEENADALFNTAQALASLAETLYESKGEEAKPEAIPLLQEAVELFSSCLTRQELEHETQTQMQAARTDDEDTAMDSSTRTDEPSLSMEESPSTSEPPDEYVTVIDPTTPSTLLETLLAQLSALTTLTDFSAPTSSSTLAMLSSLASPLIATKIPFYLAQIPSTAPDDDHPTPPAGPTLSISASGTAALSRPKPPPSPQAAAAAEASLAVAAFDAAMAEAEYRSRLTDAQAYASRLADAFEPLLQAAPAPGTSRAATPLAMSSCQPPASAELLCAYADRLVDLDGALADAAEPAGEASRLRALALTRAEELLMRAAAAPESEGAPSRQEIRDGLRGVHERSEALGSLAAG